MSLYDAFIVRSISAGSVVRILIADSIVIGLAFVLTRLAFRRFCARRRIQGRWETARDLARELVFSTLTLTVGALSGMLVILMIRHRLVTTDAGTIGTSSLALQCAFYFLALDLYLYGAHRFLHLGPVFRWVHSVHHRSRTPNPLSAFSSHPLEAAVNSAFIPLSLWLFPMHVYAVVIVAASTQIYTVLLHCGSEPFPRWWLRRAPTRWFATPLFHDLHHSDVRGNYGFYTTVWDRAFSSTATAYRTAMDSFRFPLRASPS